MNTAEQIKDLAEQSAEAAKKNQAYLTVFISNNNDKIDHEIDHFLTNAASAKAEMYKSLYKTRISKKCRKRLKKALSQDPHIISAEFRFVFEQKKTKERLTVYMSYFHRIFEESLLNVTDKKDRSPLPVRVSSGSNTTKKNDEDIASAPTKRKLVAVPS